MEPVSYGGTRPWKLRALLGWPDGFSVQSFYSIATSETPKFFLLNISKFFPVPKTETPEMNMNESEARIEKLYLSKRNLLTLLSKLERLERGEETSCAIVKYANSTDPYCNSMNEVMVIAIPDNEFYSNRHIGCFCTL